MQTNTCKQMILGSYPDTRPDPITNTNWQGNRLSYPAFSSLGGASFPVPHSVVKFATGHLRLDSGMIFHPNSWNLQFLMGILVHPLLPIRGSSSYHFTGFPIQIEMPHLH